MNESIVVNKDSTAQKLSVTRNFAKIILPCRMMISGPTMSGKSEYIMNLIKYRDIVFTNQFERILYCIPAQSSQHHYNFIQRLTNHFSDLQVVEGLPKINRDYLLDGDGHKLVIIDDMVHDMMLSVEMKSIFTVHSHHSKLSVGK